MTVTAAGAQVRTTFGACLAATAGQTPPAARLADVSGSAGNYVWIDTYYRWIIPVTRIQYNGNSANKPDEFYIPAFGRQGFYYKLAATNPYTTLPSGDSSGNPIPLPTGGNVTRTDNYKQVAALAFLDSNGNLKGYAWEPNNGDFTTKSCHGSVYG